MPLPRTFKQIRPRAEKLCPIEDLKVGKLVLVNYNMEEPKERGLWLVTDCKQAQIMNISFYPIGFTLGMMPR